jgi:hypothetical protein
LKIFDVDWLVVFKLLPAWDELSSNAHHWVLEVPLGRGVNVTNALQQNAFEVAAELGLIEFFKNDQRARLTKTGAVLLKVFRGMSRHAVTSEYTPDLLHDYLGMILHTEEREFLTANTDPLSWQHDSRQIIHDVTELSYPLSFLTAGSAEAQVEWLNARRTSLDKGHRANDSEPPPTPAIAMDLALMLNILLDQPAPLELAELITECRDIPGQRLADAFRAGLRNALFVASLDLDGTPEVSVPGPISDQLHRPRLKLPTEQKPEEVAHWPTSSEDLTTMLVFLSEPRQVKTGDDALFSKAAKELDALLSPLPLWLTPEHTEALNETRVTRIRKIATSFGLAELQGQNTKRPVLALTGAGRAWLAKPTGEQRGLLAGAARELLTCETPPADSFQFSWRDPDLAPFRDDLIAAFEQLDESRCWNRFLSYAAKEANPLFTGGPNGGPVERYRKSFLEPEEMERAWKLGLTRVLHEELLPNRGVLVGQLADSFTVQLTSVGRYVLGLEETLDLSEEETESAIVVQPDFEVLFMAPSPTLEATIAPFAERIGQSVGALFKLTRESVQTGARSGLDSEELIKQLTEASSIPVPSNVQTEIRRWSSAVLSLDWEHALVVRCPDQETAQRVLATCGKYVEQAGPTLLVLHDPKKRSTVNRACAKAGIFLTDPPAAEKAKSRKRKSRSRWREW